MEDKNMHKDGIVYYSSAAELGEERILAMQMLKRGFAEFFNMEFEEENIKRNGYGKPYYDGVGERIQFNISHCRDAVAVAVSYRRIGIDVEGMRSVNYRTASKCCCAEELSYVLGRNADSLTAASLAGNVLSDEEAKRFLQLWTLKESYVKMTGEGLRKELNQVNFVLRNAQRAWEQKAQTVMGNQAECCHFLFLPGKLALALTVEAMKPVWQAEFIWREHQPETKSRQ